MGFKFPIVQHDVAFYSSVNVFPGHVSLCTPSSGTHARSSALSLLFCILCPLSPPIYLSPLAVSRFLKEILLTLHQLYVSLMAYLSPPPACLPPLLVSSLSPVLSLLISLHLCSSPRPSPFRLLAFGPLIELASLEFATKARAAVNPVFVFRALLSQSEWAGLWVRGRVSEGGIFTASFMELRDVRCIFNPTHLFCRMLFIAAASFGA